MVAFRSQRGRPNEMGVEELFSWDEVIRLKPEVVFITNPTDQHVPTALRCAAEGMHLFVEKPLSHSLDNVDRLQQICRERRLTAYVAYVFRFHPVVLRLKEVLKGRKVFHASAVCASYLPDWRPDRSRQDCYSAYRERGGGVLLDLSHELDYLIFLLGDIAEMTGTFGRLSEVTVDSEDFADLLVTFKSNARANVHLDYISRLPRRDIVVDFDGGSVGGDLLSGRVRLVADGKTEEFVLESSRDDIFRKQLNYFFENIGASSIINNFDESIRLLRRMLEVRNGNR